MTKFTYILETNEEGEIGKSEDKYQKKLIDVLAGDGRRKQIG